MSSDFEAMVKKENSNTDDSAKGDLLSSPHLNGPGLLERRALWSTARTASFALVLVCSLLQNVTGDVEDHSIPRTISCRWCDACSPPGRRRCPRPGTPSCLVPRHDADMLHTDVWQGSIDSSRAKSHHLCCVMNRMSVCHYPRFCMGFRSQGP